MMQRSAIGISISAFVAALGLAALASDPDRAEKIPSAVDAELYANFLENEVLDIQDLAEGAEVQRRLFNRLTPPGVSLFQPMVPTVAPFDAANFDESFLDGLFGEDKNSVVVYPLSLALNPKTRETLVCNADGDLIAAIPAAESSREWPEDADPARVMLRLDLLPAEDVEPYLYAESRIAESVASQPAIRKRAARKSLGPSVFGFSGAKRMSNGNMRLTVSNGADVAEVYAYTVVHTSATVVVTYTNEQSNVVTDTNTVWTPVSPSFNGIANAWECRTTNLTLTNGVGIWEDVNLASDARTRFYAAAKAGDADLDGLSDGAEWYVNHTNPHHYDSDGDLLPDAWEVGWNLNPCVSNSPSSDQDGDGLSDLNEYRYCTDPRQADTDGDGVGDGAEVAGQPPTNPNTPNTVYDPTNCSMFSLTVGDPSGSHSERWEFVIRETVSNRVVFRHMDAGYGTPATSIYPLDRGHYKGEVNWMATKAETPDYDWRALINNAVGSGTYSGLGNTACFKVDDPDELLTRLTHGDELNLTRGREVDLYVPFSADCDIDIVQESTNVIWGSGSTVTLNVTSNSEADGDFTWDSEPAGISGTGRVLSFLPPNPPGVYTVYCRDSADTDCFDTCLVNVLKVELKVTHPQNPGPTGSAAKYNNTPNTGSADNLFATWLNEQFRVNVNIEPAALANNLPAGFNKWTAAGFTIPDNTTEYTFSWGSTGVKEVTVEFPSCGITKKIRVDVPDVGSLSQTEAAAAVAVVSPVAAALIASYAQEAMDYSNNNFPVGPQRDAFRHAYWNALCVSHIGIFEWESLLVSTGHEHDNRDSNHQQGFNSTMDLHNNAVGVTINHTTLLGTPDRPPIQNDITQQYASGGLYIWAGGGAQESSEGILVKSDGSKIYSN